MNDNYIIEDNTVYEVDDECFKKNNKLIQQTSKSENVYEQVTFSAYI